MIRWSWRERDTKKRRTYKESGRQTSRGLRLEGYGSEIGRVDICVGAYTVPCRGIATASLSRAYSPRSEAVLPVWPSSQVDTTLPRTRSRDLTASSYAAHSGERMNMHPSAQALKFESRNSCCVAHIRTSQPVFLVFR